MDTRSTYRTAARAFADLVDDVPDRAWSLPALGVWDVRALVGHTCRALTRVVDYLDRPADTIACTTAAEYFVTALGRADERLHADVAERGVAAGNALGDDPAAAVRRQLAAVEDALGRADDPVVSTFAGGMRLGVYLETRVFELTVHTLDLADALDRDPDLPPEALELTLHTLLAVGVLAGRAPEVIRLLTGRRGSTFSLL